MRQGVLRPADDGKFIYEHLKRVGAEQKQKMVDHTRNKNMRLWFMPAFKDDIETPEKEVTY